MSKSKIYDKIIDLADVHVTEHNVATIYDYFCRNVIKNVKKIKSHDLVCIFMGVITNGEEYYQHPTKKNILVTPLGNIDINGDEYKSFFSYFQRNYTPQEKNNLTAIADRLIEDTDRRNNGDFWTPTLFVDYAHKMISETLGENWKNEYVVWDNCCGAKNLTRDYKFKELYCSTLFDSELKIGERYNKEAVSFQYDFLNDPLEKLPKGLLEAFEQNKKIVFFLNPPYAAGTNFAKDGTGKAGVSNSTTKNIMLKNGIAGSASQNLYTQFLYRILLLKNKFNLSNTYISVFCPTLFLSGTSFKSFRNSFLNNFEYINAIQFNAGHFNNVSASWGISFSIWKCGETINKTEFLYKCVDVENNEIFVNNTKYVYNTDKHLSGSKWSKQQNTNKIDFPIFTSGLSVVSNSTKTNLFFENSIGTMYNGGNNVDTNIVNCALFTGAYNDGSHNVPIYDNLDFYKIVCFFAARKLIEKTWINSKDEYLAPNESHPKFQEFVNDSIVYSLFNGASNQSSLRNINYHNKLWDIKNEFFWMSKQEIEDLANEYNNDDCYNDAHTSPDRFVYKKLQEITLTPEAQAVLDKACDIVRKTFKYRELFNEEHPEYQINNWDCGWYQIKALAKEYTKEDLEEFKEIYKTLADKMRPMVYELGFLK